MSYAVYVGAGLTGDGSAYLAGYGDEPSSHWLELAPRAEHPEGTEIEVGPVRVDWVGSTQSTWNAHIL